MLHTGMLSDVKISNIIKDKNQTVSRRRLLMAIAIGVFTLFFSDSFAADTISNEQVNSAVETIWLSSLDVSRVEQGWDQAHSDRSVYNRPLTVAGQIFERGIGTHANSEIPLLLDGNGVQLSGGAGLDDETDGRGSVVFKITADGKEIWNSGLMQPGDEVKTFSLAIRGSKSVVLLALDAGDGYDYDHADWVDLKIAMINNGKPKLDIPPVEDAVILTPKPVPTPRINGAKVFGVRPGSPFLFRIAATGNRPMTFSADGLPAGLRLDSETGQITGKLEKAGEYKVMLHAKNALGQADRELRIVCGSQIGLTPAMGWNSWNCFASAVTEDKIRAAADAMVSSGLIDHGWTYVNIDDYWQVHRDSGDETLQGPYRDDEGRILPNPRFPDMQELVDYVHSKGLKIGLYSSPGPWTCGGCVGSFNHEIQDARQYAEWGFDYLKYDWCSYSPQLEANRGNKSWIPNSVRNISGSSPDNRAQLMYPYEIMREALNDLPRDIIYSLCQYGMGNVWEWGAEVGGNSWRTTYDITDTWGSMSSIGFSQAGHEKYAGPGHFNDTDMLVVGKVGWGPQLRDSRLSPNEQYTHISLWCLLSSPLLLGCDMTQLDEFSLNLLTNDEVLEVNQDPLGCQASRIIQDGKMEVWAKDMEDGSKAVGLFNRGSREQSITVKCSDLGISGEQTVRDLWRQKDIGIYTDQFQANIGRHGVVLVKIAPKKYGSSLLASVDESADNSPQASLNVDVDIVWPHSVQSAKKDMSGVTVKLETGLLRLEVCNESTIHVTCTSGDKFPEKKEFVVNRQWAPVPFEWHEGPEKLILRTIRMGVEINRATGAVQFIDAAGKTLLQEPSGGGRVMKLVTSNDSNQEQIYRVQQTFLSPDDEYLYGMAQCQDGVWNWRGIPIELRQLNTQAALPVLLSSRGYGLLWDNASLTDFNPVDQEITLSGSDAMSSDGPTATEQLRGRNRGPAQRGNRTGTFTTGQEGEYVFFAKNGDRRNEIGIVVNGQTIAHIQNMWVPYTTVGKISLPANTTCSVQLLGGGRNARLYARPLGNTITFRSQAADSIDYYFFYGPEFDDIIAAYRNATGAAPLWPKWAYGFWQCRERYSSQQQILDTAAEFRKRQIPIDLIVQDWQYWGPHGWGAYEWDASKYPDPEKLIQSLHRQNLQFMISVWSNPQGKAGADLKTHNYVIPGTDWVDVFNPAARELRWKYLNDAFFKIGTDAWWQDATEPGDDGNAMANHRVFWGSGDLYRNAYPLFANQTVYEGQRKTNPDKRVCILTRSAFPGQQRYATALWSGDVAGNWDAFRRQMPAGLHVCLTGLPYWTTDCGGFFRPRNQYNSEDFADLLIRWFQFSTFSPVQRMHGYQSETEFWKFPQAQETLIEYDRFRYRLLPYIYSIAWQVTHDDYTIMRALPMDFRSDPKVYDICDQYMFGPAFLVNPVTEPKAVSRSVYLPAPTKWTNFWTGESSTGGRRADASAPRQVIPLFVRAGSIIPLGPDLQYADEKPADPIELRIYTGANGTFTLYEDEGDNYSYEKGVYATIPIQWNETSRVLTIGERKGDFPGMLKERTFHIVWVSKDHGVGISLTDKPDVVVKYKGETVNVSKSRE